MEARRGGRRRRWEGEEGEEEDMAGRWRETERGVEVTSPEKELRT